MPGLKDAMKYAYSNTRVKAMESKLVSRETLERMLAAKDPGSIAAMLLQTEYKSDVERFGGVKAMGTLVDFALSKNLGKEISKLISIAPKDQRAIMIAIVGEWDIGNIKVMLEAVASKKRYEDVSEYIIDTKYAGLSIAKEATAAKSVDEAIAWLTLHTPYAEMLDSALDAYKRSHSVVEANAALEQSYYLKLGGTIQRLSTIDREAAGLIRSRIDMRNVLLLLEAKKHRLDFSVVSGRILPNGTMQTGALEKLFKDAKDAGELAASAKAFGLKQAAAEYAASGTKPLMIFEIAMLNEIFRKALRSVRHSVLSFGALVAFLYLKEVEVFTLRILIKGRSYGLSDTEIKGMISWLK
ncbi:MAG: V-type ATPase subunit [Candidatus Marsarchaeota archaeon]|nr:V-type ATPase subunit [Candidatus Marsarchaeota archaeon]